MRCLKFRKLPSVVVLGVELVSEIMAFSEAISSNTWRRYPRLALVVIFPSALVSRAPKVTACVFEVLITFPWPVRVNSTFATWPAF